MTVRPPSPELDLIRFAYVLKAAIDREELTFRGVQHLTGVPITLVSRACNGIPVNAGATFMLAAVFDIDLATMMNREAILTLDEVRRFKAERAEEIRQKNQVVSVPVSRVTVPENRFGSGR